MNRCIIFVGLERATPFQPRRDVKLKTCKPTVSTIPSLLCAPCFSVVDRSRGDGFRAGSVSGLLGLHPRFDLGENHYVLKLETGALIPSKGRCRFHIAMKLFRHFGSGRMKASAIAWKPLRPSGCICPERRCLCRRVANIRFFWREGRIP